MQIEAIKVTGMTCGGCVNSVTLALTNVKGVQEVNVNLPEGLVIVKFEENFTDLMHLKATIQTTGYGVQTTSDGNTQAQTKGCCG